MKKQYPSEVNSVSRRDFLKGIGGGTLGAAVAPRLLVPEKIPTGRGDVPLYSDKRITMKVNGRTHTLTVASADTLLEVLRDRLHLTGSKRICDRGECGGCTVLLDERPVYACMYLAVRADGKNVQTVEGLADGDRLHPLQESFITDDGYQCGFCTPGFLMSSLALLKRNPDPGSDEIRSALSGNLCRCGNYQKIFTAVSHAAESMKERS